MTDRVIGHNGRSLHMLAILIATSLADAPRLYYAQCWKDKLLENSSTTVQEPTSVGRELLDELCIVSTLAKEWHLQVTLRGKDTSFEILPRTAFQAGENEVVICRFTAVKERPNDLYTVTVKGWAPTAGEVPVAMEQSGQLTVETGHSWSLKLKTVTEKLTEWVFLKTGCSVPTNNANDANDGDLQGGTPWPESQAHSDAEKDGAPGRWLAVVIGTTVGSLAGVAVLVTVGMATRKCRRSSKR
jgi:hypothetical protein